MQPTLKKTTLQRIVTTVFKDTGKKIKVTVEEKAKHLIVSVSGDFEHSKRFRAPFALAFKVNDFVIENVRFTPPRISIPPLKPRALTAEKISQLNRRTEVAYGDAMKDADEISNALKAFAQFTLTVQMLMGTVVSCLEEDAWKQGEDVE